MIGRDFELFGTNGNILRSFGDNEDHPFLGPVKVKFVDKSRLAVIDKDRGLHIQNLNGIIEAYIMPQKHALSEVELAREEAKQKKLKEDKNKEEEWEEELSGDFTEGVPTAEDDGPTNYMDLSIADLCTIPMSKHIAVCDILTTTVKLVNREDWVIERHLGETRGKFDKPQLKRLSGISAFQLGFKIFYAVCERCDRIQILSEGGKTVREVSKSGLLPGELNDPVNIATFVSPAFIEAAKREPPDPSWYMGEGTKQELAEDFAALVDKRPGDFLFVQREGSENVFDGKYITPSGLTASATVVKSLPERDTPSMAQLTMNESSVSMMPWPSVWEAVANCPSFTRAPDPRPFVLIAVTEKGNRRVQVLKYFWMSSELFRPVIVPFFVIGGVNDSCNCHLVHPQSVAFTPTGEVAVCDDQARQISIVSTVSQRVVRVVSLSFISHLEDIDNPCSHTTPLARNRDQRARDRAAQDQAYRDYLRNFDYQSRKRKLTKNQFLGDDKKSSHDPWVTSIDFCADGKLAIGFRLGGILVLKPFKISDVGSLTNLEHCSFNLILDYCEYAECEALRETCTFLHNYTSRRRQAWALAPLGGARRKSVALLQFLHWAKIPPHTLTRVAGTQSPSTGSAMLNWVELKDEGRRVCCPHKWLHPEKNVLRDTRVVRVKKPPKKEPQALSSFLRKKEVVEYENKQMIDFRDVTKETIMLNEESAIMCSNLTCDLSHHVPVYDPHHLKKFNGFIDLPCVLLSVAKLCGDVFLYKNEAYITNIFEAFSVDVDIESFHDPMTKGLEVIREISKTSERCLELEGFMELLLMCEEDISGAKPLRRQFLFHRLRVQRKFVPAVVVPGPAMGVLEHGNLVDVIKTEADLGCLLHANEVIQYRDGIAVPHKKNMSKKYKRVEGVEKEERGVDESAKLQYNKAFIVKADRAESMLDKMFS